MATLLRLAGPPINGFDAEDMACKLWLLGNFLVNSQGNLQISNGRVIRMQSSQQEMRQVPGASLAWH
jgi:hypothetical protein